MTVSNPGATTSTSGPIWQLGGSFHTSFDLSGLTAVHGVVDPAIAVQNNISGYNCASTPCNVYTDANGNLGHYTNGVFQGDVINASTGFQVAGSPLFQSPAFTGTPTAPTATPGTNTTQLASTAFVTAAVAASTSGVSSFNGRTGAVAPASGDYTVSQVTGAAPLASPAFTGTPTAPTAAAGTNTTQLASTAFVQSAVAAATTGVSSFNGRTGAVAPASGDYTVSQVTGAAPLASPALTGTPTAPTQAISTNNTDIATTAAVSAALAGYATSGVNSNITSLTGLTTPLTVAQGGIGAATAAANTVFGNFTGGSAAPGFSAAPVFSAAALTNFPTLNQNTTGNAATATSATTATNIAGGVAGSLHYQSAPSTTALLAPNTAATDQVVVSHGTGSAGQAPTLSNAPALSAANMTGFPTLNQNTTGSAGTVPWTGVTGGGANTVTTATSSAAPWTFNVAGAASTPGVSITGAPYVAGTASTNFPQFFLNSGATAPTTFSTAGEEFGINAPSGYTGNLINAFINGSSTRFRVDYAGDVFNAGYYTTAANGSASQAAFTLSGAPYTAGTATTNYPLFYLNNGAAPTTWSTSGTVFGVNATSGFAGNLLDLHSNGGSSLFSVNSTGAVNLAGASVGWSGDTFLSRGAADLLYIGPTSGGAGGALTAGTLTGTTAVIGGPGNQSGMTSTGIGVGSTIPFAFSSTSAYSGTKDTLLCRGGAAGILSVESAASCTNSVAGATGTIAAASYATASNCSSSASPAVCASASAGSVAVPAGGATLVVNTTATTANSQISLTFDSSLGAKLGVTCNSTINQPSVSARTAGTSFTITMSNSIATNPDCLSYTITN